MSIAQQARAPLPYSKYVVIMLTLGTVLWIIAAGYMVDVMRGHRALAEELFAVALAAVATLSAAMIWCTGHVEARSGVTLSTAPAMPGYQTGDRATIGRVIRSASVLPFARPSVAEDTERIGRPSAVVVAEAFDFGRRLGKRDAVDPPGSAGS